MNHNDETASWEGKINIDDTDVFISIGNEDEEGREIDENGAEILREKVEEILNDQMDDIKEMIIDFVVDTYNEDWNQTEKALKKDEVFDRVLFDTADLADGSIVTLYLKDGGLFEDHSVAISYDLTEEELWEPELLG